MSRRQSRVSQIAEGPKRLSKLLKASVGIPSSDDGPEEEYWVVGGRYQVLQSTSLHARPDLSSERIGQLRAKDTVLLLALQSVQAQWGSGEVVLAYLANTKRPDWVAGWGQIEGSLNVADAPGPVLRRRRLQGSWEVGGRYVVVGSPVLRSRIELESEQMCEIHANEEVLALDLGLVIRSGEPRLRARVRADSAELGWLTIELPGGAPLLEPCNLYSEAALTRLPHHFGEKHRKSGRCNRVTLNGQSENSSQAWEANGKYRLVERVVVHEAPDLNSRAIGELRRGTVVFVRRVELQYSSDARRQFLEVSNEHSDAIGWICPLGSNGEKLLDSRDHLEFEKLMRLHQAEQHEPAEQDTAPNPPEPAQPAPPPIVYGSMEEIEARQPFIAEQNVELPSLSRQREAKHEPAAKYPPEAPLVYSRGKEADVQAAQPRRQESARKTADHVARPWENKAGGYRTLREMESGEDERQIGENLENENYGGICSCRNGLLNCGAYRDRIGAKVKSAAYPHPMNHGMMGEPAPEPRPMRQLPSPPAMHATAMPNN